MLLQLSLRKKNFYDAIIKKSNITSNHKKDYHHSTHKNSAISALFLSNIFFSSLPIYSCITASISISTTCVGLFSAVVPTIVNSGFISLKISL